MTVLVSDASVLIDLERGVLLRAGFSLPETFAVPDILYGREIEPYNGKDLIELGLQVMGLDDIGIALVQNYMNRRPISTYDAAALALAKTGGHILLTGDGRLRGLASEEKVECHGVLWVLDRIEQLRILTLADLEVALSTIDAHPRRRLPADAVLERLMRYRVRHTS